MDFRISGEPPVVAFVAAFLVLVVVVAILVSSTHSFHLEEGGRNLTGLGIKLLVVDDINVVLCLASIVHAVEVLSLEIIQLRLSRLMVTATAFSLGD